MKVTRQAAATVLVVDDEPGICRALSGYLERTGHRALTAGSAEEALSLLRDESPQVAFVDLRLPGMDGLSLMRRIGELRPATRIVLITAFGDVDIAIEATQAGAYAYLPKPFDLDEVGRLVGQAVTLGPVAVAPLDAPGELVLHGRSARVKELREAIERAAAEAAPVVLFGEVGSGRESAARALHRLHGVAGPFRTVRCSDVPAEELDAALEAIAGGPPATWFLTDLEDLEPERAASVLERARAAGRDAGGARVVASARRSGPRAAGAGADGSQELRDRAAAEGWTVVTVPSLRERPEDLPDLMSAILARIERELRPGLAGVDEGASARLREYGWPGNLRELENALRSAAIAERGEVIRRDALPASLRGAPPAAAERGKR